MPDPKPEFGSEAWFHDVTSDDRVFSTQDGCKKVLRAAVAEALEWAASSTHFGVIDANADDPDPAHRKDMVTTSDVLRRRASEIRGERE